MTDLQHHTVNGVIAAGQKIMDVVPCNEPLVIEASVINKDIKRIRREMPVKVQLDAYKARMVPKLTGRVTHISADKFDSNQLGAYYKVHIKLLPDELKRLNTSVELQVGMPVTVFIVKGQRNLLQYWFDPLKNSFYKAMREE